MAETDETTLLESKKLALEIADLERPWWKKPAFVLAALPTMLATVTLIYGLTNGYFSVSFAKLENQKIALTNEIHDFEARRDALSAENEKIKRELEGRTEEAQRRREEASMVQSQWERCKAELKRLTEKK